MLHARQHRHETTASLGHEELPTVIEVPISGFPAEPSQPRCTGSVSEINKVNTF